MSAIKILLALAVCFGLAFCNSDDDHIMFLIMAPYSVMSELDHGWKYCPENTTNRTAYSELLSTTRDCFYNISNTNESICHTLENHIQTCFQPVVDFYVDCLPEETKDFPPAIAKGATSVIDAFCTSSGELLLELMNKCIYDYPFQKSKNVKEQCTGEVLEPKLKKFRYDAPSKSEFCLLLREVGDCWQYTVNLDCESSVAKKVFTKFYGAALAACRT